MKTTQKEDIDVKEIYGEDAISNPDEFISKNKININGLDYAESINNLNKYGTNEIKQTKPKRWYNYFLSSLTSPFNLILLGISMVLLYTDVILPAIPSYANITVILILVLVSTLLEFTEEYRSNKAAAKLKDMIAITTTVLRRGEKIQIPIKDITIGDVVILSAGDMVPADLRIIESKDLYAGQSSITGESDAVRKKENTELSSIDDIESITDLDTICLMGTNIISGSAKGVVIKIADETYFGKIAQTLLKGKPKTSFEKGLANVSKLLIEFMLAMIPLTFLINAWKHDILMSFTFSVAIAICITPLLLPVILSSSLSKGAVNMSKKKTIVKKLDSIQSFGAMNILCTDKTGTLTEDRIILEKYLDVHGNEDLSVLKYAFINSYFQTGLNGSIDEAIIKRALENDLAEITHQYTKIDEIPFDFTRRMLSVIVKDDKEEKIITKGAVEEILSICNFVKYKNEVSDITTAIKDKIRKISEELNAEGLRVVAVCERKGVENIKDFNTKDETNMTLLGFVGFLDPPKESAKIAVKRLNEAGIRVVVLTGDNAIVTKCICDKVGINSSKIVNGIDIDKLHDLGVIHLLKNVNIFAKLSPIQKARIIRLLKEAGNVVRIYGRPE